MNFKTIELLLLQLEEAFSKSRSNIYSDVKKENHFIELYNLFSSIKDSNYKSLNSNDLSNHYNILTYIFKGLEYLDNSTLNIIPYEIIACLEYALEDWISQDDFIIVTSLSNKNLDFYFESTYSSEYYEQINTYIYGLYNLKITHRLIRISLPKVLSRDYLSMVVLYHELGHFVDNELNISQNIVFAKYGIKREYSQDELKYYNHTMEYFADLFAAQYINDASNIFLTHISSNAPDSQTHPSTVSRVQVVNKFLIGNHCVELIEFNNALTLSSLSLLKIRYTIIDNKKTDFANLIPQRINNKNELHYIFKLGWDIWHDSDINFLKDFNPRQKYNIINNLIEKSISNFTITEKWAENI